MKFYIDDKVFDYDEDELEEIFIGEGEEGSCYRVHDYVNNFVMKIHHKKPEKIILDEDTCKVISNIDTERIKLPNDLIYDKDGNYIGYTVDYVDYKKPKIRNLKIGRVVNEFYKLEKDVDVLSKNNVYIDDLNIYNTIFSDGIYICDPGSFSLAENKLQERYVGYYNKLRINEYEISEILFNLLKFNRREEKLLRKLFLDNEEYISDIISFFGFDKEEKAAQYFKGLVS